MHATRWSSRTVLGLCGILATAVAAQDFVGPQNPVEQGGEARSCSDCHELETQAWKHSSHFLGGKLGEDSAKKVVEKLVAAGKLAKEADPASIPLCTSCHGTQNEKPTSLTGGVSCESCHGAAGKWLLVHNLGADGKPFVPEKEPEGDDGAHAKRESESIAAGMIRTSMPFAIARNCLNCHALLHDPVPDDGISPWDMVAAGHPLGSEEFELVAFSQGEVRHNFLYSTENKAAPHGLDPAARRRALLVCGHLAALDAYLKALAVCDSDGPRDTMVTRYDDIIAWLESEESLESEELSGLLEDLPEADADQEDFQKAVSAGIGGRLEKLANQHTSGAGLDDLEPPGEDEFKGSAFQGK